MQHIHKTSSQALDTYPTSFTARAPYPSNTLCTRLRRLRQHAGIEETKSVLSVPITFPPSRPQPPTLLLNTKATQQSHNTTERVPPHNRRGESHHTIASHARWLPGPPPLPHHVAHYHGHRCHHAAQRGKHEAPEGGGIGRQQAGHEGKHLARGLQTGLHAVHRA